jgi:hypothetical protein
MRTLGIIFGAILLSACGNSPASGPGPVDPPADWPGTMVGGTCTGSIELYCARGGGRCAGYEQAVARLAPLCAQGNWVVQEHQCVGVYRSISWRDSLLGGGDEYFNHEGQLLAAFAITDYFPYCNGRSGSQVFGEVPVCPTARITTSLCARYAHIPPFLP